MKQKIKTIAIITTLMLAFLFLPKYTFAAGVLINEIMYDLAGVDDGHEWVELYNTGSSDIDLTGAKINDGDTATNHGFNLPPKNGSRGSLTIPAGGFLLLADDAEKIAADLPNYSGSIIDTVINLNNTSATLKILDKDGIKITSIAYDKNMGANGNGKTLEWNDTALKESYIDGGTPGMVNSILTGSPPATSVSPSPDPTASSSPSPSASPSPDPAAAQENENDFQFSQDIYLNEFLPYPQKDTNEWIELYNTGQETVSLTGWQIDDEENSTKPQSIPGDTQIKSGEFLVIELPRNILNNDGDTVRLLWPDDQVVHSVSYQKAKQNIAYARFANGWLATNQPTPGAANKKSIAQTNVISSAQASDSDNQTSLIQAPKTIARQDIISEELANNTSQKSIAQNLTTASLPNNSDSSNNEDPQSSPLPDKPNLSANIQDATQNSSPKTILILLGLIIFSALAAIGLIYFRRQQTEKIDK